MESVEKDKHQENIAFLKKLLKFLEVVIVVFAIFISFVLLISYGIIIFSGNQELAKTLYLPIKKTIILIHQNWIIVIPILLLMFHDSISQFIETIEEMTTPFGGVKRKKVSAPPSTLKTPTTEQTATKEE